MPRATAAADDASCSLSADASSFRFEGTRRLYGDARFDALTNAHVVVLGLGGVGSWAAEALARSGVGALTLVDLDFVCVTNVNRQVLAADSSVGDAKAEVMRARVLDINPACDVRVVTDFVTEHNVEAVLGIAGAGSGRPVDHVLDAVDGENDKAAVVACCVHHRIPVLVTGGAGGIDTMHDIVVEDLANATFNRLLQRVRRLLRREYAFPKGGEGAFPGKKKNKKDGKFGVSAVYARENANHFRALPGTKGRGGIGCDGVGGSAVFVTGALGFKAASHIALRLMEAAEDGVEKGDEKAETAGRPAAAGWRSRVWPRGKPGGGDGGGGDGGGDGGGGGGGGGGDGCGGGGGGGGDGESRRDGDGGDGDVADVAAGASLATGAAFAANASSLEGERTESYTMTEDRPVEPPTERAATAATLKTSSRTAAKDVPAKDIFDAHCHWHLDASAASATAALSRRLAGAAFTSTEPPDWPAAELAAADSERARGGPNASRPPGFGLALGLHPWWAHLHPLPEEEEDDDKNVRLASSAAWLPRLRARLEALPGAIVGEIGLDRASVPLDPSTGRPLAAETLSPEAYYANQRRCFAAQLSLAADLRRPCAVHCVRAYGDVGEAFRLAESFPPRVLMHSYGGSGAFAEGRVRMKADGGRRGRSVYVGFSAVVNLRGGGKGGGSRKDPKAAEAIRRVPADRLLVESDLVSPAEAEAGLREMLAFVAETRGWTLEDAARITRENAERFYGPVDESDAEQV